MSKLSDTIKNINDQKTEEARLMLIGAMATAAANLENTIEMILLGLLDTDMGYGGATIRFVTTPNQLILINTIVADIYGEDSDVSKKVKRAIYGHEGKGGIEKSLKNRHDMIHAVYSHEGEKITRKNFKRKVFDVKPSSVTIEQMQAQLGELIKEHHNLIDVLFDHDLPFPKPSSRDRQKLLARALNQTPDQPQSAHPNQPPPSEGSQ